MDYSLYVWKKKERKAYINFKFSGESKGGQNKHTHTHTHIYIYTYIYIYIYIYIYCFRIAVGKIYIRTYGVYSI